MLEDGSLVALAAEDREKAKTLNLDAAYVRRRTEVGPYRQLIWRDMNCLGAWPIWIMFERTFKSTTETMAAFS